MRKRSLISTVLSLALVCTSTNMPAGVFAANEQSTKSITLNVKSEHEMYVGTSKKITVKSVTPKGSSKKVTFNSNATSVVKVDKNGIMKALKAGNATITVTSVSNKKVTKKVKVTVKNLVKNNNNNQIVIPLDKKKTTQLSSSLQVSNLNFISNKKAVATVSAKGVITGKKAGTAKITVTGKKGSIKNAKQVLTVYVAEKSVKSVELNKNKVNLSDGDTLQLDADVTPASACDAVVYTSSDKTIASVDGSGKVTTYKAGTVKITATTLDGKKTAVCTVVVSDEKTTVDEDEEEQIPDIEEPDEEEQAPDVEEPDEEEQTPDIEEPDDEEQTPATAKPVVETKTPATAKPVVETKAPATEKPVVETKTPATAKPIEETKTPATAKPVVETQKPATAKPVVETKTPVTTKTPANSGVPASIQLNKESITLEYGKSTNIRVTITPEEAADAIVTWTSSDTSVATVNDGAVLALSAGDAVITATTANGLTATCNVHVNGTLKPMISYNPVNPSVGVESISFNKTEITLTHGKWEGLVMTVNPENATDKEIIVSSSNTAVATAVNQGLNSKGEKIAGVVAGYPGVTYVTATVGGKTATCKVIVTDKEREADYVVPYIATRYFDSCPTTAEDVIIPYYMTDSKQSEYVKDDTTKKLNLVYEVDSEIKKQANLSLGEHELNLGKLSEGEHIIGIQAEDPTTGKRSHRVYVDVKVEAAKEKVYTVKDTELTAEEESAAKAMTDKLNTFFAEKVKEGYQRVVLPKDSTYTIDGTNGGLLIPSGLTVDLNGSTIKMVVSTGAKAAIVTMDNVEDAHITGGILVGDRGQSGASGAVAVRIKGSEYCTITDMKIQKISGNAFVTERTESKFSRLIADNEFKRVISQNDKESTITSTPLIDLTELKKESDYVMIGCNDYQKVVRAEFGMMYINFYDSDKKLISTVEGYQHRKTKIPENAQYVEAKALGGLEGIDRIRVYFNALCENVEIKNVQFESIANNAIMPTTFNHLLVEGCTFTGVGQRVACMDEGGANGAGGGWTECQDLYYCNNKVTDGYKEIYFNTGRNLYLENLTGHNISFNKGVLGGTIRDMNDKNMNISWTFGPEYISGYARIFDNTCRNINVKHISNDKVFQPLPEYRIKNCTLSGDGFNSSLEYVEYVNCTFTNFNGNVGVLRGCTLNEGANVGADVITYSK